MALLHSRTVDSWGISMRKRAMTTVSVWMGVPASMVEIREERKVGGLCPYLSTNPGSTAGRRSAFAAIHPVLYIHKAMRVSLG